MTAPCLYNLGLKHSMGAYMTISLDVPEELMCIECTIHKKHQFFFTILFILTLRSSLRAESPPWGPVRKTDNRQTDRKRYIWGHRANCTGGLKNGWRKTGQVSFWFSCRQTGFKTITTFRVITGRGSANWGVGGWSLFFFIKRGEVEVFSLLSGLESLPLNEVRWRGGGSPGPLAVYDWPIGSPQSIYYSIAHFLSMIGKYFQAISIVHGHCNLPEILTWETL